MSTGLHRTSSRSLWEQARDRIHDEIKSGQFRPGDRLPTEQDYAKRFGISLNPVRAALQQLVQAGVIERINGRGTFVLETKIANQMTLLSSCTRSLREQGLDFSVSIIDSGETRGSDVPESVRLALKVTARSRLFTLARLIHVEGEPAIILRSWMPMTTVPTLASRAEFEEGLSLYSYLESIGIRLVAAHARLDVEFADAVDAELLGIAFGAPLLAVESVASNAQGTPVETSRIHYNSKRISLTFDRVIEPE
ncbi:GntR family transcriptional regulator [soil metagenome]